MLPPHIKDALDSILGDMDSEEADQKRKRYAPAEEPHKAHGVQITIVTGGKHPEPDGDEKVGEGTAGPLESPEELEKLLGAGAEPDGDEEEPEQEEAPQKPKKKLRRY